LPQVGPIVGILLAAGRSERFGSDKLLHRLAAGTPLVLGAARALRATCDRTVAIVRPGCDELAGVLAAEGVEVVINAQPEQGMGHSLACGVRSSADAGAWLVALADMPFIAQSTFRCVVDALRAGSSIAAPWLKGRRGHPVGFSSCWFEQLAALSGDAGARSVLSAHPDQIHACAVDDINIFRDIDERADLGP